MRLGSALAVIVVVQVVTASMQGPAPGAKACLLLPLDDLEAYYGAKGTARGIDGTPLSTCTATIGNQAVNVQSAPEGTAGLPSTIAMGLAGATARLGQAKGAGPLRLKAIKDLGTVGCYATETTGSLLGTKIDKPLYSTTCFVVDRGYLTLTMTDDDPKRVSFDIVRQFVEKAAAKR